jgi:hypothetical protein
MKSSAAGPRIANLGIIADWADAMGLDLREARVVPDEEAEIVAAVNALRARYAYVFTTGGIGPTHDDITADAVAKAFGVPIGHNPEGGAPPRGVLCRSRARAQRSAHAHGPNARRRGDDRQFGVARAGVPHRQRVCHGRHPEGDDGDARVGGRHDRAGPADAVGERRPSMPPRAISPDLSKTSRRAIAR